MANVVYETKKPSILKRGANWVKGHTLELMIGGFTIGAGVAGYTIGKYIGTATGKADGIRTTLSSLSDFFKNQYPNDVETFGQIGASVAYDHILEKMPDLAERLDQEVCWGEIADCYFAEPFVKKALSSGDVIAGMTKSK